MEISSCRDVGISLQAALFWKLHGVEMLVFRFKLLYFETFEWEKRCQHMYIKTLVHYCSCFILQYNTKAPGMNVSRIHFLVRTHCSGRSKRAGVEV
jgi:hypothetical protein